MNPLYDVVRVEPLEGNRLSVEFEDGAMGEFDMSPYLDKGVFKALKNKSLFDRAYVDYGTVVWPGEIDLAPETIYNNMRVA